MTMPIRIHLAHAAILMLAEVKTAIEAYRSAARSDPRRDAA